MLFSICRFNEYTNNYPRNITVIGFQFKKKRFLELHRFSLKFPLDRFNYIGIDPDNSSPLGRFVGEVMYSILFIYISFLIEFIEFNIFILIILEC